MAYDAGASRARQLKSTSSNWLWWPEVDLANRNSVINWGRLFSDDPKKVSKMAIAAVKGVQDQGVAATAKHFPGTDEIEYRDPHASASMLNITYEEWEKRQGKLFKELIDAGVYSVMIGHQSFPGYDNTKINGRYIPATVSYKIITELLKEKMGFSGVVVTV
jgi:beta-N-acetylhexosaminidase